MNNALVQYKFYYTIQNNSSQIPPIEIVLFQKVKTPKAML